MSVTELIKEIQNLPISERIYVLEKTIKSIRQQQETDQMREAADELLIDYQNDKELTAFTDIDCDQFYEPR